MSAGQLRPGVELAPRALRELCDLPSRAAALGWRWVDRGDAFPALPHPSIQPASPLSSMRNSPTVGASCAAVHAACLSAAREGDFVLLAGGDHSVAAGSVSAALAARPDCGVVWVDAHADINTSLTSLSGSAHGMPVALLMGREARAGPEWGWLAAAPRLEPRALVYIGLRDLDDDEAQLVHDLGVRAFSMADVDRDGIARVMEEALRALQGRPLHCSFDVDACDPAVAPGTGTAVPGGLSYREAHFLMEALAATRRLVSMDVVEVNATLGGGGEGAGGAFSPGGVATAAAAARFVASALGKVTLGPRPRQRAV